jgi:tRNA(Arg) A34 adenosine deaminase TadA
MRSLISYTWERALAYRTFTGAFILQDGEVIGRAVTSIEPDKNPLAHAELKVLQSVLVDYGPSLARCHLYTTQQPCPMCASAVVWSGVERVVYGIPSSRQWRTFGHVHQFFSEAGIACVGPVLEDACREIDAHLTAHGI